MVEPKTPETIEERSARMRALALRGHELRRMAKADAEARGEVAPAELVRGVLKGSVEPSSLAEGDAALVLQAMRDIIRSKKSSETAKVAAGGVLLRQSNDFASLEDASSPHREWRTTLELLPVFERLSFLREVQGLPVLAHTLEDAASGHLAST
jgi:hypothetical protein